MQRVAFNRTWAYLAHRRDWVTDADNLRAQVLDLEERLSTALHDRLTEHFVEERTQVRVARPVPLDVALEGDLVVTRTVALGMIRDLSFVGTPTAAVWFGSGVVRRQGRGACIPEAAARAQRLAQAPAADIAIGDDLRLRWEEQAMARLVRGPSVDRPALRLLPLDLLDEKDRETVRARAAQWLSDERARWLAGFDPDDVRGPLRGLLYLVSSQLGVVPRKEAESLVRALTAADRKRLATLDVRLGAKAVYARGLLKPAAQPFRAAALAVWLGESERPALPDAAVAPRASWSPEFARRLGYPRYGTRCVRVDLVERIAAHLRKVVPARGVVPLPTEPMQWLGCSAQEWDGVVAALGYEVGPGGVSRRSRKARAAG